MIERMIDLERERRREEASKMQRFSEAVQWLAPRIRRPFYSQTATLYAFGFSESHQTISNYDPRITSLGNGEGE